MVTIQSVTLYITSNSINKIQNIHFSYKLDLKRVFRDSCGKLTQLVSRYLAVHATEHIYKVSFRVEKSIRMSYCAMFWCDTNIYSVFRVTVLSTAVELRCFILAVLLLFYGLYILF